MSQRVDVTYNRRVSYAPNLSFTLGAQLSFLVDGSSTRDKELDQCFAVLVDTVERQIRRRLLDLQAADETGQTEFSVEWQRQKILKTKVMTH